MSSIVAILVNIFVVVALYGLWRLLANLYVRRYAIIGKWYGGQLRNPMSLSDVKDVLEIVGRQLGLKFDTTVDEKELNSIVKYQGGIFCVNYRPNDLQQLEVVYPGLESLPLENIDSVRSLVNHVNNMECPLRAYYTINDADNAVIVHMKTAVRAVLDVKVLSDSMEAAFTLSFEMALHFRSLLADQMKEVEKSQDNDMEYSYHRQQALTNVLELQVTHDAERLADGGHVGFNHDEGINVGQWLDAVGFLPENKLVRLDCYCEDNHEYADTAADIRSYPLLRSLRESGTQLPVQDSMIRITYRPFDAYTDVERPTLHVVIITLTLQRTNANVAYYRLDYLMPQMDAGRHDYAALADVASHPLSGSMLLAVDTSTEQQARAEFRYMWDDARDKQKENNASELTAEQSLLLRFHDVDNGYFIYWGHRYLREKRYLEAYLMLQPVWHSLNTALATEPNDEGNAMFLDLCFWMATCLYRLGRPERALYYMDFCQGTNQTRYVTLTFRCQMATHDHRALQNVQSTLAAIQQNINDLKASEQDVPDDFLRFRTFLRRSEVQLLIENDNLALARERCTKMLDEKELQTFAIEQLETIEGKEHPEAPAADDAPAATVPTDAPSADSQANTGGTAQ